MLNHRLGGLLVVPVLIVSVAALAGCGKTGDGGRELSTGQRAKTAKICADVASSVKGASVAAAKVADGSMTQNQAEKQLRSTATHVVSLSAQNPSLPITPILQNLGRAIYGLGQANAKTAAEIHQAAGQLVSATQNLMLECQGAS